MPDAIAFLGQQSWMVEMGGARILVDPMLDTSFGHSDQLRFEIYPSRRVDLDQMPPVDAVVVTNEHLDHFHLPSLRRLPADVPVVTHRLMPKVCTDALEAIGRKVQLLGHDEPLRIGGAELRLLLGDPDVPVWESRVASLYVKPAGAEGGGVFIQSDTSLSQDTAAGCTPEVFIATHNAQVPPAGELGAFDNMLPVPEPQAPELTGLDLLFTLLNGTTEQFPSVRLIALSGGGYVQAPRKHGSFLWNDFAELEDIANALSIDKKLIGLAPGELAEYGQSPVLKTGLPWVTKTEPALTVEPSDRQARGEFDPGAPLPPIFERTADEADMRLIHDELAALAPLIMLAPLGRGLINSNAYLGGETGPLRFAVHLRGTPQGDVVHALDFNSARFEPCPGGLRDALFTIPSGIDVNAGDLAAVLRGEIHIWELAVSRMRQWYLGDRMDSPVGFLYGALSEQVRPDLAARMYRSLGA
ncbi:MBL fold metallo-hydrolase [Streptomyces sp. NPDC057509]|uniref:MBL fold metallo-hydrolase n=1 Tax=Streptomyces sp. NPDC057509 TaxID=3346152 RepID=UPI003699EEFF